MIANDLENTTGEREAIFVRSKTKLAAILRQGKYATVADDNGALGVWRDDDGKIHCQAMRHKQTIEHKCVQNIGAAQAWFVRWTKKIA